MQVKFLEMQTIPHLAKKFSDLTQPEFPFSCHLFHNCARRFQSTSPHPINYFKIYFNIILLFISTSVHSRFFVFLKNKPVSPPLSATNHTTPHHSHFP